MKKQTSLKAFFLVQALFLRGAAGYCATGAPDFVLSLTSVSLASVGTNPVSATAKNGRLVVTNCATIRNSGGGNEDFSIKIASTSGGWQPVSTPPGSGQYRLSALWHQWDVQPSTSEFQDNDILTSVGRPSSDTVFFNDTDTHSVVATQGMNLAPLSETALYFMFEAPSSGSGSATAHVNITAVATGGTPGVEISTGVWRISTGGVMSAGDTTVIADAGVQFTNLALASGQLEQTFLSTQSADVNYGNGFSINLFAGSSMTAVASTNGLQATSTGTISMSNADLRVISGSGTVTLLQSPDHVFATLAVDSRQDVVVYLPAAYEREVNIRLSLSLGETTVIVPAGSFPEAVRLTISPFGDVSFSAPRGLLGAPSQTRPINRGVEVRLDKNLQPSKPVQIQLRYRDLDLAGADPATLKIGRLDEASGLWVVLPTELDDSARVAVAYTRHFSRFQLLAVTPATDVEQVRVFPNPLKFHQGQTEMTFKNLTSNAILKIYTYSGELVRDMTADASGLARWDGRNRYGEKVSGGMYMVLIESAAGSKKVMRIGVEK